MEAKHASSDESTEVQVASTVEESVGEAKAAGEGCEESSDKELQETTGKPQKRKPDPFGSTEPVSHVIFSEAQGDEVFVAESEDNGQSLTFDDLKAAVDQMDGNIDEALGHAADSIWSFATNVTGRVTNAVKDGQPGLENLRKNVTSRLAPVGTIGRDLTSHIGTFAQNDTNIASLTGSVKSVAASVQRNAVAMEAAILAKANQTDLSGAVNDANETAVSGAEDSAVEFGDPAIGVIPMNVKDRGDGDPTISVNEEIAKVGETISNSLVGQTVGGLWSGLWNNLAGDGEGLEEDGVEESVPKTRFEQRIFELQANPDTYCEPAKDLDAFEAWSKSFLLDDHADGCIAILDAHAAIAELYERVVPRIVDEDTFWMRYFFARYVLEQEEERRKKLLERAEHAVVEEDNDDEGWGDDDWDEVLPVKPVAVPAEASVETRPQPTQEGSSSIAKSEPEPDLRDTSDAAHQAVRHHTGAEADGLQGSDRRSKEVGRSVRKDTATNAARIDASAQPENDWGDDDWE